MAADAGTRVSKTAYVLALMQRGFVVLRRVGGLATPREDQQGLESNGWRATRGVCGGCVTSPQQGERVVPRTPCTPVYGRNLRSYKYYGSNILSEYLISIIHSEYLLECTLHLPEPYYPSLLHSASCGMECTLQNTHNHSSILGVFITVRRQRPHKIAVLIPVSQQSTSCNWSVHPNRKIRSQHRIECPSQSDHRPPTRWCDVHSRAVRLI